MELTGLSFENYKAFPNWETLALRPLTILIGRNSSGKSAIARFPLLLAQALSERAQSPLDLDIRGVDFGGSFVDLIHNRTPHGAVGLGATFESAHGERIELWAKVQHFSEFMMQVVDTFEVKKNGKPLLHFKRSEVDPQVEPALYGCKWGENETLLGVLLSFQGLWPIVHSRREEPEDSVYPVEQIAQLLAALLPGLRGAVERVGYLGPFRTPPVRQYRFPGGAPQSVGVSGYDAPALLGVDSLRKGGIVLKAVSEWYRDYLGGWILDISRSGDSFSLVLRNPDDPNVEVNLVDVGTGLSQVLPLVVQRLFETLTGKRGSIEIVEQPELHLHPGAHGDLADLYIEAAKHPGSRFLIETHSENFILRIRRRIAEGTLDVRRVGICWVDDKPRPDSQIVPITLYPNGDVSSWPRGVFAEDFDEVRAIRAAKREGGRE
ncbi:AAA family ATPase [Pyxidicoccus fallax]|uniref:AAA family ATPase n=1 Tax=Pyxidicoccus fallax TaxID=394095 RepID=A0A848LB64_9BACT|nr:AAA family ATPase [Pyxidicoccus fallax]NMO15472.1 AAA family ATPase [Pyxidicoccus fallax]NPC78737.1 AAA family ATPase [Pyxidicoccus fallax]